VPPAPGRRGRRLPLRRPVPALRPRLLRRRGQLQAVRAAPPARAGGAGGRTAALGRAVPGLPRGVRLPGLCDAAPGGPGLPVPGRRYTATRRAARSRLARSPDGRTPDIALVVGPV